MQLVGVMSEGRSGYIAGLEADGRNGLVHSNLLPTDRPWEGAAELGLLKGVVLTTDPMFTQSTLPEGWHKEGSDHGMWSYLIDERGFNRIAVFYKGFDDRSA